MKQMRITSSVALVIALAINCVRANDESMPDFSQFLHSEYFNSVLSVQTNAAWQIKQRTNILALTDFAYGNDRIVDQYFISQSGKGYSWRWSVDFAHQPGKDIRHSFSNEEINDLESCLTKIPSQNRVPSLDRLVIVSFKSDTNWVTRAFDRKSLPPAMLGILQIANLGIQTNN